MKIKYFLILLIIISLISGCSNNKAEIIITKLEDSNNITNQFPEFPEKIELIDVKALYCSGSQSSIDIECHKTIEKIEYSIKIKIPAGEKLGIFDKSEKGIEFITDNLPCTITSKDYKPYPNVLDSVENPVKLLLEINNKESNAYDFIDFALDKIIIHELFVKNNKLSIRLDYYGISTDYTNSTYGNYSSLIKIDIKDIDLDKILVD